MKRSWKRVLLRCNNCNQAKVQGYKNTQGTIGLANTQCCMISTIKHGKLYVFYSTTVIVNNDNIFCNKNYKAYNISYAWWNELTPEAVLVSVTYVLVESKRSQMELPIIIRSVLPLLIFLDRSRKWKMILIYFCYKGKVFVMVLFIFCLLA